MKKNKTTYGLGAPVCITTDADLVDRYQNALQAVRPHNYKNYQRPYYIKQNGSLIAFTSHFYDSEREYQLQFVSIRRQE